MKRVKPFDCVKMKDEIHAKLTRDYRGLTDEQISRRVRRRLATSNDPIARLWRSLEPKETPFAGSGGNLGGRRVRSRIA
jgi:hypothetical protein